jgi:hypothetical protein
LLYIVPSFSPANRPKVLSKLIFCHTQDSHPFAA